VKIRVVAVGTVKQAASRELIDEYLGRVRRYCTCEQVEIRHAPGPKQISAFAKATSGAKTIALDPAGDMVNSQQFAQGLERYASQGKGVVAFLIGGAAGLPAEVVSGADVRWSLSRLTLPHRLARVMLAEQIYRAMSILRNEPYDK
jgi:23S rRNA (pseudouridine1915-N3)-methyltransferase